MSVKPFVAVVAASLLALAVLAFPSPAGAAYETAQTVAVSGSTLEVFGPGQDVLLLAGALRTAEPTDLLITVSLECAIRAPALASGLVEAWVEVDGAPVPVADAADGRVAFCDQTTPLASSFQWIGLDLPAGDHAITVRAELTEGSPALGLHTAAVGKRTLVADPTDVAGDVVL